MCINPMKGMHVRVVKLMATDGMTIHQRHLSCRKEGTVGTVLSYVGGHGGDVWFVQHEGSLDIGAYSLSEMEEVKA